jgi:TonB-linked SusC/RagA family outer membrane protein
MKTEKWKTGLLSIMALVLFNICEVYSADSVNQQMTLIEAIEQISEDYEVYFTFDKTLISDIKVHYDRKENENVEEAVSSVLKETSLTYKLFNQRFLIIYKKDEEGLKSLRKMSKYLERLIKNEERTISALKNVAPQLRPGHSPVILENISGTVVNDMGEPLIGVTILVKGTDNGTATDLDGSFELEGVDEQDVLVFSYIGYIAQEILVGGKSEITVTLIEDSQALDEVVVVGYGTTKKRDLTGSVSSISKEEIENIPVASVDQALGGLAPGVNVVQTSGQPGAGTTIRIRGGNSISANNEPLYVVDGFIGVGDLNTINPEDIESIEVLKDAASLAIYGTRGANGVVLITTKKGAKGALKINYHGYGGVQNVFKKIDLMNAQQFAELRNEVDVQQGLTPFFPNPSVLGEGTDWQDQIFRSAPIQNHQLSFSGGSDATQYYVSANYFNQEGIILNSGFERYSLRFNLNSKVNERVSFGNSISLSRGETSNNTIQTQYTLEFPPTIDPFDAQGNPTIWLTNGRRFDNPITLATVPINENIENKVLANLFSEVKLLEGLMFKASFGVQATFGKSYGYAPQTLESQVNENGTASLSSYQTLDLLNEYTLNYKKTSNDRHYFDVLAGFTLQDITTEGLSASSSGFVNDALTYHSL